MDEELEDKLIIRANQIAELVNTRNIVLDTIRLKQDKQKSVQNKKTKRILRTFLERDTIVFRKNDGMITKLEPRWVGPFKILDHDERGNYLLVDSLGEGVKGKFPLEKLRIVGDVLEEDAAEVKEILKDRTINNKLEYLVSWKDGSENSWVNEDDFLQVEIINKYWKNKTESHASTVQQGAALDKPKKQRGRPKKVTKTLLAIAVTVSRVQNAKANSINATQLNTPIHIVIPLWCSIALLAILMGAMMIHFTYKRSKSDVPISLQHAPASKEIKQVLKESLEQSDKAESAQGLPSHNASKLSISTIELDDRRTAKIGRHRDDAEL